MFVKKILYWQSQNRKIEVWGQFLCLSVWKFCCYESTKTNNIFNKISQSQGSVKCILHACFWWWFLKVPELWVNHEIFCDCATAQCSQLSWSPTIFKTLHSKCQVCFSFRTRTFLNSLLSVNGQAKKIIGFLWFAWSLHKCQK